MYIHDSKGNSSPVLAAQSRWERHAIHILLPIWFRCQELSVSPGYSRPQASCAALITGLCFLNLALCWYQKNSCAWLNPQSHLGLSHLSLLREVFLCWIWSRQLTCITYFPVFFLLNSHQFSTFFFFLRSKNKISAISLPSPYHNQKNNNVDIKGIAESLRDRTVQVPDVTDQACFSTSYLAFTEVYG